MTQPGISSEAAKLIVYLQRQLPPHFWLVSDVDGGDPIGYLTSPAHSPELETNIAMGFVPVARFAPGTRLTVWLPEAYQATPWKQRWWRCRFGLRSIPKPGKLPRLKGGISWRSDYEMG